MWCINESAGMGPALAGACGVSRPNKSDHLIFALAAAKPGLPYQSIPMVFCAGYAFRFHFASRKIAHRQTPSATFLRKIRL